MILPIVAFGFPILRQRCSDVTPNYPGLHDLIENMKETMFHARGVGLAAPQINKSIRLFLIDTSLFVEDKDDAEVIQKVFINAKIIEESGEQWIFNEGCLSIPSIREDITRRSKITIEYMDEDFQKHIESYDGLTARVIQHEYDHIEGILFTDKVSALRKRMIKGKMVDISKGKIDVNYKMKFLK